MGCLPYDCISRFAINRCYLNLLSKAFVYILNTLSTKLRKTGVINVVERNEVQKTKNYYEISDFCGKNENFRLVVQYFVKMIKMQAA